MGNSRSKRIKAKKKKKKEKKGKSLEETEAQSRSRRRWQVIVLWGEEMHHAMRQAEEKKGMRGNFSAEAGRGKSSHWTVSMNSEDTEVKLSTEKERKIGTAGDTKVRMLFYHYSEKYSL